MTENQRIVKWNEDRLLIKTIEDLDIAKEISFVVEELIEMISPMNSEECRGAAERITREIMKYSDGELDRERAIDGLCDIKVFATGTMRKLGYDPDLAMDEVLQEIETRVGSIQDGKFVKDKSPEAQANWYKADFTKADLINN